MESKPTLPRDDSLPGTLLEFAQRFSTEAACERLLRRWKYGDHSFVCPRCASTKRWRLASRRLDECRDCGKQTSLTAGTVFHRSSAPLPKWFLAMFLVVSSKQGISAVELARQVGVSYPTAWTWLHKFRSALGLRTAALLDGCVEVDETYEGGVEPGAQGRQTFTKALVGGVVEIPPNDRGFGRARLRVLKDASQTSLKELLNTTVAPGTAVMTDGWWGYTPAATQGLEHFSINVKKSGKKAHQLLPGVHRVFALMHRVLLTTHQGAVSRKHLQAYLDEFTFRFNRRQSASRGLLFQRLLSAAVRSKPPEYWRILGRPNATTPLREVA